ncbi:cytochrome C assembly family protein [Edaphobacillus lindanitolerans]|uniref:HemX protein n=1 Tax=Edaphobacillus lindanitolerans TaxID=550447 RepID=A0A1U7PPX1_9BACI|nr:cytochrome c biogenesis protein [Edaphobacillus lindanitolerans]SIT83425.1 HemX protein [Edaphobacillus lindanitolerans]
MTDIGTMRLHEVMVVVYAVSLVFYFIDFLNSNVRLRRIAEWTLILVWILQSVFLGMEFLEDRRLPVLSLFEGVNFYAWLIISLSLVIHLFRRADFAVFFLNGIGFVAVVIATFGAAGEKGSAVGDALISELLFIHITSAMLAYTAFSLSFVFAILYLRLYRTLKKKDWNSQWGRLPSLEQAKRAMTFSVIAGVPILLVSLILGLQWAFIAAGEFPIWDPKIIGSFLLIIIYCILLYMQRRGRLNGPDVAWGHIFAFLALVVNFLLISRLSVFHFWY